jgi:tetratricopeptide (TPR) repeat protein
VRVQALVAINVHQDYATALPLAERSQRLWLAMGDLRNARRRLLDRATCWAWTGREVQAADALAQCEADSLADDDELAAGIAAWQLGRVLQRLRRWPEAVAALQRSVRLGRQRHSLMVQAYGLLHLPNALVMAGQAEAAARLHGFAVAHWEAHYGVINRIEARELKRTRRLLRVRLGVVRAEALALAGRQFSLPAAVSLALQL